MSAVSRATRAGDAAEGDADAGGGEGGGVVDAVADHAGRSVAGVKPGDGLGLVFGEQAGAEVVDAEVAGDGRGGRRVVAGEHDVRRPRACSSARTAAASGRGWSARRIQPRGPRVGRQGDGSADAVLGDVEGVVKPTSQRPASSMYRWLPM